MTDSCLWFDEIFSVHAAEHPWGGMFWFVAQDLIHPPLFYALLKVWISIGGESLLWLRLLPVVFAVLALFPFLQLCRELKLKTSAIVLALAFFAVNGSLIKYAQEVRMYSLLLCLSLFSIWLFARFFYRGKNIWILTLVNVLLVHTHYFGWLVVFSEVVIIAILQRVKIRHVLIMTGIATVAFLPWLLTILRAANAGSDVAQNIGWIERPGFKAILDLLFDLFEPFYFQASSVDPASGLLITVPIAIVFIVAKALYLANWKPEDRERILLLSILIGVPVTSAFLISWLSPYSVWGVRHLIGIFAPVSVLFAIYLTEIANGILKAAFLSVVGVVTLIAAFEYARTPPVEQIWCAWEKLAVELPTDGPQTVYAFEDLTAYHLWFATRTQGNVNIVKIEGMPGMAEDKAYFLPRGFDGVSRKVPESMSEERFWVAFRDMRWDERHLPLSMLSGNRYTTGVPVTIDAGGVKVFMTEVRRIQLR